ncbi:MAG: hypothetical protein JWR19_2916 [Pedosphaera sp.]|nr:hypothetical protein [Pedosphaera sp.]
MKKERKRVTLEPELEELALFWRPQMRLIVARKFARWARQLRVSAFIMIEQDRAASRRPASLRRVPPKKAALN